MLRQVLHPHNLKVWHLGTLSGISTHNYNLTSAENKEKFNHSWHIPTYILNVHSP